jgi:hypothetical protein
MSISTTADIVKLVIVTVLERLRIKLRRIDASGSTVIPTRKRTFPAHVEGWDAT